MISVLFAGYFEEPLAFEVEVAVPGEPDRFLRIEMGGGGGMADVYDGFA